MSETIGVVGLGVMGTATSGHLLDAGYEVIGFDIDPARVEAFVARGGTPAESGAEVARRSDMLMLWLASVAALDAAVDDVVVGAHQGLLVLDMGTFPLKQKQIVRARLAEAGADTLDAPVSGSGIQAAEASVVVFASGSEEGYQRALPLFSVIGRQTHYLGEFGQGSVMKYIANLLAAVHNLAAAEAHVLGIASGLDPGLVQEVIGGSVAGSPVFDFRGPMMVADDYGQPAGRMDILMKDAVLIRDYAGSVGAPTPLLDAAIPVYDQCVREGLSEFDAAVVCRYLERTAGLQRVSPA